MLTRDAMCARTLQEEIDKRIYCMASTSQKSLETSNLNGSVDAAYAAETFTGNPTTDADCSASATENVTPENVGESAVSVTSTAEVHFVQEPQTSEEIGIIIFIFLINVENS